MEELTEEDRRRLGDVRRWRIVCEMQVDRYNQGLGEILTERMHKDVAGWSEFQMRWQADRHFIFVAGDHLRTALAQAGPLLKRCLPKDVEAVIDAGRDVLEHWVQHRPSFEDPMNHPPVKAAGRYLRASTSDPWSTRWNSTTGADVGGIDLTELVEFLHELRELMIERGYE